MVRRAQVEDTVTSCGYLGGNVSPQGYSIIKENIW